MKRIIIFFCLTSILISCSDDLVKKTNLESTFDMFWTYMDEHYVYFDEKKLNWDSLYKVYSPRVKSLKNEDELDSVFQNILN
mgnify:FL=1